MSKKIAMVFPGQGSQSMGMLSSFLDQPIIRETFQEASQILAYDLWDIIQTNPDDKLNQTAVTQPALLTASIALWRLWSVRGGITPIVLTGHSLGEYTALVCSGVLAFRDAVMLVSQRGKLMQEATPAGEGAMAAIIGLSEAQIEAVCQKTAVSPANLNAPGQVVIAGSLSAVEQAMQLAKTLGAKLVKKLDVSVPSHCTLMQPASEQLNILLKNTIFNPPKIPVIHNYDANSHQDSAAIRTVLTQQLVNPVRWVESIENLAQHYPVDIIIECGAGKILTGLNKRIVTIPTLPIADPALFEEALNTCSA